MGYLKDEPGVDQVVPLDEAVLLLELAGRTVAVVLARGQRPLYRVRANDGRWAVDALTWLRLTAASRRDALAAARSAIAECLEVPEDAFDVEA